MSRGLTDNPSNNPFEFGVIQGAKSMRTIEQDPGPKVVITSQPGLEAGFGRDLFAQWCEKPENLVAFTCTLEGERKGRGAGLDG